MKIVQFKDGQYGIRKRSLSILNFGGFVYYDFMSVRDLWWGLNDFSTCTRMANLETVKIVFNRLNDYGTEVTN